jgi:hypothetical protein
MLRKISLLTAILTVSVSAYAQSFKFGVHIDPGVSFMNSNDKKVKPDGANMNFAFGVEMEKYFSEKENYAITFGANFAVAKGGKLAYGDGGILLPNSTLDNTVYFNNVTNQSANAAGISGENMPLAPGTTIKYNISYVELPVGLKLRTNELGQSYMRAFFHLPIVTVMVPVSARATVNAPRPDNLTTPAYFTDGAVKGENIYKDVFPIQLAIGTGAGVEWAPNDEGGLRLIGGIYYNYGVIDAVKSNQLFQTPINVASPSYIKNSASTGFHNISLRIGVVF